MSTPKPRSYILPSCLIGITIGATLTYTTEKIEFAIISIPLSLGYGLLRDTNIANGESQNMTNALIKST